MLRPTAAHRPSTRRAAFTLVELIAVLVILGIVAAIAIPTYRKVIDNAQWRALEADAAAFERGIRTVAASDFTPPADPRIGDVLDKYLAADWDWPAEAVSVGETTTKFVQYQPGEPGSAAEVVARADLPGETVHAVELVAASDAAKSVCVLLPANASDTAVVWRGTCFDDDIDVAQAISGNLLGFSAPAFALPPGNPGEDEDELGGPSGGLSGADMSDLFGDSPADPSAPGEPQAPTVVSGALTGTAVLSWDPTVDPGTNSVNAWRARCASTDGGVVRNPTPVTPPTAQVGGLSHGYTYVCQVAAVSNAGVGAWSPPSAPVTLPQAAFPEGVIAYDDFDREDSADLGTTPVGEFAWHSPNMTISNKTLRGGGYNVVRWAVVDLGTSDAALQASETTLSAGRSLAIVASQSPTRWIAVGKGCSVYQYDAGTLSLLLSKSGNCSGAQVAVSGNTLTVHRADGTFAYAEELPAGAPLGTFWGWGGYGTAVNNTGTTLHSIAISGLDAARPAAPENVFATASPDGVTVRWETVAQQQLDRFEVVRDGVVVGHVGPGARHYLDDEPGSGTRTYEVVAVDQWGNESAEPHGFATVDPTAHVGRVAFDDFARTPGDALGSTVVGGFPWEATTAVTLEAPAQMYMRGNAYRWAAFDAGEAEGSLTATWQHAGRELGTKTTYMVVASESATRGLAVSSRCEVLTFDGSSVTVLHTHTPSCPSGTSVSVAEGQVTATAPNGAELFVVPVPAAAPLGTYWGVGSYTSRTDTHWEFLTVELTN